MGFGTIFSSMAEREAARAGHLVGHWHLHLPNYVTETVRAVRRSGSGIDLDGDHWDHYAKDPLHWVKTELEVCRNYHQMFIKMVGADDKYCHGEGPE